MAEYGILHIPISKVYACGKDSTSDYPEVSGSFSVSDGIVQNGDTVTLASPVSSFTLSTDPVQLKLPDAGKYIKVNGVIYQTTSESKADWEYWTEGGYTSTQHYSTSIYIYNLNKVILGTTNAVTDHSVLVDSVQRGLYTGIPLVNGTAYKISKGRTLIDSTGRDILFGPSLYMQTETWNDLDGASSAYGKASISYEENADSIDVNMSYTTGWFSAPGSKSTVGMECGIFDEETGAVYQLQVGDIVEWEFEGSTTGLGHSRILFFTKADDSWNSYIAEFTHEAYETSYYVQKACYVEFSCYIQCAQTSSSASMSIKRLTINGQDVWL